MSGSKYGIEMTLNSIEHELVKGNTRLSAENTMLSAIKREIHSMNQLSYAVVKMGLEAQGLTPEQAKEKINESMKEYNTLEDEK